MPEIKTEAKKKDKLWTYLPSCPFLPESYIEFFIQQILIVCTHIDGNRQALKQFDDIAIQF